MDSPGRREATDLASELIMPEKAFEHLRDDLAASAGVFDRGAPDAAYQFLGRSVRTFLEAWMAIQNERDAWASRLEQEQFEADARQAQESYR